jgi:signal transduction histidine kinase
MHRSIRFSAINVSLCYVAVSITALAIFATPLWYAWRNTIEQGRAEALQADAKNMTNLFSRQGAGALAEAIDTQVGWQLERVEHIILLLADPALVKRAGNLPSWPREVSDARGMQIASINVGDRMVTTALLHTALPGGYHLLVGRDINRFEKLEKLFLYGLLGCAATVLVVALLGGLLIRRALLSRIHGISQTTAAIVEGDLSRRLPTPNGEDELDMLAHTVNRMLDQIEQLIQSVRNASNAIAHDLRTPLAELRSRLEELVLTRPVPEETFADIDAAITDVDRVIGIFNALLRLAEIDSGTRRSGFIEVNVTEVVTEVAEFYQPVAEIKGIALVFASSDGLLARGDPLLLAQAIGNLIDNALKYAQHNGVISVQAKRRSSEIIEIVVSDDGPGIPDAEKSKVVERFYRGDASRGTPGVGLGLSLVAAVARLHGGWLELRDNQPGLRAVLLLDSDSTGTPSA